MWRLFCDRLFVISQFFGASGMLCVVTVEFSWVSLLTFSL